ncbi:cell division protein PerM [Streptomyces sp. NPDC001732]
MALAIPTYGQDDTVVVGWTDRLRIALAMLLQAFGGNFELRAVGPAGRYEEDYGNDYGGGYDSDGYGMDGDMTQGAVLSVVPLTVTVLWLGALFLAARAARKRGEGMEAAVRISLVASAVVLVLGLFSQPDIAGVSVSSAPLLATLGALVLSLPATAGALYRDESGRWRAQSPAVHAAVRVAGTAVRALGIVLLLCSLIGFVSYANIDDVDGEAMLIALPLLPNIGLAVLGVSWGAPVEYDVRGRVGYLGSGTEHGGFGLSELGDEVGGWAVACAVATGVVCALVVGITAARRSADRREQAAAGALFLAMFLVLCGIGGVSTELSGGFAEMGGQGTAEFAPSVPDALLFGLLWVGGAVFVAPYLLRMTGRGTPPAPTPPGVPPVHPGAAPFVPAQPGTAPGTPAQPAPLQPPAAHPAPAQPPAAQAPEHPAPAAPEAQAPGQNPPPAPGQNPPPAPPQAPAQTQAQAPAPGPYDAQTAQLSALPAPSAGSGTPSASRPAPAAGSRRRTALVWTGTLLAALLVGGGATAGVLFLMDDQKDGPADGNKPAATAGPSQEGTPSTDPSSSAGATPSASGSTAPTVPEGFRYVSDTAGFSLAVPTAWDQRTEKDDQITYSGSTGRAELKIGVIRNASYTSYENFRTMEATAEKNQKNYRRIQLSANTFQGLPGAIWEYTYEDGQSGETIHAIDQSHIAEDGTEYAVFTSERDTDWEPARKIFDTALSTWLLNDVD